MLDHVAGVIDRAPAGLNKEALPLFLCRLGELHYLGLGWIQPEPKSCKLPTEPFHARLGFIPCIKGNLIVVEPAKCATGRNGYRGIHRSEEHTSELQSLR